MRFSLGALLFALPVVGLDVVAQTGAGADANEAIPIHRKMKIIIGQREFLATLEDNETADAFRALLPLKLDMHDVNENEKAFDLPSRLPSADTNPRTIRSGDIMLWSSRTVVVFYKSFSTRYSYTRLGRIEDPAALSDALGAGDVTVTFELQPSPSR